MTSTISNWLDRVHPELKSVMIRYCPDINFNSWWKLKIFRFLMRLPGPTMTGISSTRIKGIGMKYFPTTGATPDMAFVLYIHGGGRIMGSSSGAKESELCSKIAQLLNVPVLSATHRLAPDQPYPAALDDVADAYKWLVDHMNATSTGGDNEAPKILVVGESAGGGLAAELCQRLLDERNKEKELPLPVAHLMIYPMLDDRTSISENVDSSLPPNLVWNHTSNLYAWGAYLGNGNEPGQADLPEYAVAARRKDLTGLPPAWITAGDLDLLCPESRDYIARLQKAGVDTKYEEVEGGYHGFLTMSKEDATPIAKVWKSFQEFGLKYIN